MINGADLLFGLFMSASIAVSGAPTDTFATTTTATLVLNDTLPQTSAPGVPDVPFYSQLRDIHSAGWQKRGCGIASLAMIIEFYHPGAVSVDTLLAEGIAAGAYAKNAGWKHADLARLGERYGLEGESYDLSLLDMASALAQFRASVQEGPVIASVHYKLDPQNIIPHLVVITGIDGEYIHYNDPAELIGGKEITIQDFMKAWKKRYIVIRSSL